MNILQVSKDPSIETPVKSLLSKAWKRGSKPEVAIIVLSKPFFLVPKRVI